jgi:galactoside 2-L-fucosyltransferase 1/2
LTYIEFKINAPETCPGIRINFWGFKYASLFTTIGDDGKYAAYNEKFLLSELPRIRIDSCLQSYKYFDRKIPIPFRLLATQRARLWIHERNITAAIHVRRGDKVGDGLNVVPPESYFKLAIKKLADLFPSKSRNFVVVTDDPKWVQGQTVFREMHILSSDRPDFDMAVISASRHKILSIGTFGWWGAYLSDKGHNKTSAVVYPTLQMMNSSEQFVDTDYFPQHWTGIDYALV